MFRFFKKSLKNRLLFLFMIIGFVPFLTLLLYAIFLSETKILNKMLQEQHQNTEGVAKLIDNHIDTLIKEVRFLSSLDIMDDILSEDIDKRVSRLLMKKADDLNLEVSFVVIDKSGRVVASSNKDLILKVYAHKDILSQKSPTYVKNKTLYIDSKIHASFDSSMEIATLVLEYKLDNLETYLMDSKDMNSYITDSKKGVFIGKKGIFTPKLQGENGEFINATDVIVYKRLSLTLGNFYLVYSVDKDTALEFLYDFIHFMLYISVLIFLSVLYLAVKYSKEIVKPIEELTQMTQNITQTHNYSSSLVVDREDEIATLSDSFNIMIQTTSLALEKLEDEIALMKKTKAASNAKSTFISSMSHELRTPLNSIIGSAQYLMVYEELNEKQIDSIGTIESAAEYLLSMINEILDIAKIEAGKMEIHIEELDLLKELENCFEILSPLADDKNLFFRLESECFDGKRHKSDAKIFKQIVINLLSNAIKFTKEGGITTQLYSDDAMIYIRIKDTGVGVAKEHLSKLFEEFTQIENEMQQKSEGSGLGLSLSKKMATLIDGDIVIQSEGLGHGCEVIFSLRAPLKTGSK